MIPSRLIFSLDVGGTRTKFGLIDSAGRSILAQLVNPTCTVGLGAFLVDTANRLDHLCAVAGVERSAVRGCGIGLPGFVAGNRVSALWHTIAFLEGDHFLPGLAAHLGIPVRADNDARVVALGEAHFGGHAPVERLLSLTLGSGLGFGLVVGGRLQEPTSINHLSGHIPIRPLPESCYCGFHGCLEMLVNADGLLRSYNDARLALNLEGGSLHHQVEPDQTAQAVFESARMDDPAASQAVKQWLADLSAGLNAYIYLFGPDLIVLGGGLSKSLAPWMDELQASLFAEPYERYQVRVTLSQIQEQAGMLGAAALCL